MCLVSSHVATCKTTRTAKQLLPQVRVAWQPSTPSAGLSISTQQPASSVSVMAANVVTLTTANFDETIRSSNTPVLVDFWAEWCGPCKQIDPVIREIATEKAGALTVAKLNVDDHGDIAMRFNVMSIPTMIVFKNGAEVQRLVGARGKAALLADLAGHLA
jgi:thioredoxin 1